MNDPLPTVLITVPPPNGNQMVQSSLSAKVRQSDGKEFPLTLIAANIKIDWNIGDPVIVDLTAIGGFALEVAAGVHTIEINGKKYRLVEEGTLPRMDGVLLPEQFASRVAVAVDDHAVAGHQNTDKLMEDLLVSLGYEKGVEIIRISVRRYE